MAWSDYCFDYKNGAMFNSPRFNKVLFNIVTEPCLIKDLEYKLNIDTRVNYEVTGITGGDDSLYMIGWFEVGDYNVDAIGRGLNDIYNISIPSLNLPSLQVVGNGGSGDYSGNASNYPLYLLQQNAWYGSSPFSLPTQVTDRKVTCNFPIIALYSGNLITGYDVTYGRRQIHDYSISGDWKTYIEPLIEMGVAININFNNEIVTEPEGNEFTIYNTGQRGTWSAGDIVTDISTPYYRWAKIKLASTNQVDGRLAFYKAGLEDGVLKLKPKNVASVISCQFSTDGGANWIDYDSFPFEYIYAERTNELGTFIYATRSGLSGQTGVPVFDDEETATKWVNHDPDIDITQASNYEQISNRYPQSNKTGQKESSTFMGDANNFRSHFTQKYLLDRGDISIIVNALFDTSTNIFEDIKKGLEMFGEKIIDSICGLAFYPIDLTTVFSNLTPQSYIYFGGYQFTEAGFSVNRINSYNGYLDLGNFTIEPSYPDINDVRNYSPYCNVSIYLPYCGLFQLNYNKYVGKTVSVRYYIDINTGGCLVCLFADGLLYDYFNGTMATQIPITVTDYSGFANAELRNLSNLAGVGGNMATLGTTGLASAFTGAGQVGGVALGGASNLLTFEKSMYELSTTNINNFNSTKGSSGAIGNQYLPQYIYLIFEYIDVEETANLIQLEGKPSNRSGTVNSFSGYLEVDSVNLICSGATESEKQEIEQLLHSGIII